MMQTSLLPNPTEPSECNLSLAVAIVETLWKHAHLGPLGHPVAILLMRCMHIERKHPFLGIFHRIAIVGPDVHLEVGWCDHLWHAPKNTEVF